MVKNKKDIKVTTVGAAVTQEQYNLIKTKADNLDITISKYVLKLLFTKSDISFKQGGNIAETENLKKQIAEQKQTIENLKAKNFAVPSVPSAVPSDYSSLNKTIEELKQKNQILTSTNEALVKRNKSLQETNESVVKTSIGMNEEMRRIEDLHFKVYVPSQDKLDNIKRIYWDEEVRYKTYGKCKDFDNKIVTEIKNILFDSKAIKFD